MEVTSHQDNPKPAPGRLALVQDFVNTLNMERGTEELLGPEDARDWLAGRGLLDPTVRVTGPEFRRLVEFRESLRGLLAVHNGACAEQGVDLDRLGALARSSTLNVTFGPDGDAHLVPTDSQSAGLDRAIAVMLAIIFRATVEGTWRRLKACRSERCRWVFFDNTKNRSGAWCVMDVCGSRAKMREYRRRSAAKSG